MDKPNRDNIILIGFMGVGKTTVGKLLSQRIGYEFIDTDDLIVSTAGIPITDIFSRYGESYFRILKNVQCPCVETSGYCTCNRRRSGY